MLGGADAEAAAAEGEQVPEERGCSRSQRRDDEVAGIQLGPQRGGYIREVKVGVEGVTERIAVQDRGEGSDIREQREYAAMDCAVDPASVMLICSEGVAGVTVLQPLKGYPELSVKRKIIPSSLGTRETLIMISTTCLRH